MSTATAADAVSTWLAARPELAGWRIQFGRWVDGSPSDRYAVLRPVGGAAAGLLREPKFTLLLVGAQGDTETAAYAAGSALVEASRSYSGALVQLQAGEPTPFPTSDGRPAAEIAISTITN
jgi:hypothetical protein